MSAGKVVAVCTSTRKGMPKKDVGEGIFQEGFGLVGDAHGGDWHRQVSLLSMEEIDTMKNKGVDVAPGSFAENITTEGIDLRGVQVGDELRVGSEVRLEVTQIGKECHTRCAIYHTVGSCIMPEYGIFARVLTGGRVATGDEVDFV